MNALSAEIFSTDHQLPNSILGAHKEFEVSGILRRDEAQKIEQDPDFQNGRCDVRHINPAKAALSVGFVVGLWHALWVSLVAAGVAQQLLDFILRLHFVQVEVTLAPFAIVTATELVAMTFAVGASFGLVFALVWNWLTERSVDELVPDASI